MAQNVTARTDQDHRDALERYQDDGHADSKSEALRQTSQAELARMGYLNGTHKDTPLMRASREVGKVTLYVGLALVGITYFAPISFRIPSFVLLFVGVTLFGLERALKFVTPTVFDRLKAIRGENA